MSLQGWPHLKCPWPLRPSMIIICHQTMKTDGSGRATTTEAIRRAIQNSEESLRTLAKRYGINQKTVLKWKNRTSVADLPTGPKDPKSTVLSVEEEAAIVAFRKHALAAR